MQRVERDCQVMPRPRAVGKAARVIFAQTVINSQ